MILFNRFDTADVKVVADVAAKGLYMVENAYKGKSSYFKKKHSLYGKNSPEEKLEGKLIYMKAAEGIKNSSMDSSSFRFDA